MFTKKMDSTLHLNQKFPSQKMDSAMISQSSPTFSFRPICILYEDSERTEELVEALLSLGYPKRLLKRWAVIGGFLDIDLATPPKKEWLYFSRLSASASMRKHEGSIAFGRHILEWLDFHGCDVINGIHAFELEISKVRQYMALQRAGIPYPSTRMISCESAIASAVSSWIEKRGSSDQVFYIKPVTGGSGMAVKRYTSYKKFESDVKGGGGPFRKGQKAPDALYLLQESKEEHIEWFHRTKKKLMGKKKLFYRAEFINQKFLYVLRIATPVTVNSTCPCDAPTRFDNEFDIVPDPGVHFGDAKGFNNFIQRCIGFMKTNAMFVGAFEFSRPGGPGTPFYIYDINPNTNYNEKAEKKLDKGQRGLIRTAKMLMSYAHEELGTDDPPFTPNNHQKKSESDEPASKEKHEKDPFHDRSQVQPSSGPKAPEPPLEEPLTSLDSIPRSYPSQSPPHVPSTPLQAREKKSLLEAFRSSLRA